MLISSALGACPSLQGFIQKRATPQEGDVRRFAPACFLVSHELRFIAIKLAKTGGSTILKFLKEFLCGVTFNGSFDSHKACNSTWLLDHGQGRGADADCLRELPPPHIWKQYFVFVTVRDPMARRRSMVDYCRIGSWCDSCSATPKECGRCDPIHCAPMAGTVISQDGRSFVDYIAYTETLNEDMLAIFNHINRLQELRKARPMNFSHSVAATLKTNPSTGNAHTNIGGGCPETLWPWPLGRYGRRTSSTNCLKHYADDARLFGSCDFNVTYSW